MIQYVYQADPWNRRLGFASVEDADGKGSKKIFSQMVVEKKVMNPIVESMKKNHQQNKSRMGKYTSHNAIQSLGYFTHQTAQKKTSQRGFVRQPRYVPRNAEHPLNVGGSAVPQAFKHVTWNGNIYLHFPLDVAIFHRNHVGKYSNMDCIHYEIYQQPPQRNPAPEIRPY